MGKINSWFLLHLKHCVKTPLILKGCVPYRTKLSYDIGWMSQGEVESEVRAEYMLH